MRAVVLEQHFFEDLLQSLLLHALISVINNRGQL
jgi:hypothetical protein